MIPDQPNRRTDAQNQALHMVLLLYTVIEGYGADSWLEMAKDNTWHQEVICTVEDIRDAMQYMDRHYWTTDRHYWTQGE